MTTMSIEKPVSEKQRSFIEGLLAERETSGTAYKGWEPNWSAATSRQASGVIKYLLTLPKREQDQQPAKAPLTPRRAPWESIPVGADGYGYYALESGPDEVKFFRVQQVTEGRWSGYTFANEQGGDSFYPIEPRQRAYAVLTEIAQDPATAGLRYAQHIGRCYRCHKTLTDDESRARGLGPYCAGMVG